MAGLLVLALLAAAPLPRNATQDEENQWQRQQVEAFLSGLGAVSEGERIHWRPPSGRRERINRARLASLISGCRQVSSGQTVRVSSGPTHYSGERGVGIWVAFTCTGPGAPAPVIGIDFGFRREGLRRVNVSTERDLRVYCPGDPPEC